MSINSEDDFLTKDYSAVVVQPEVLNSDFGKRVIIINCAARAKLILLRVLTTLPNQYEYPRMNIFEV